MIEGFPCICGHEKKDHATMHCRVCYSTRKSVKYRSPRVLHVYQPDNLKYLEEIYKENHK